MDGGNIVAIAGAGVFVALCVYGIACDLCRWFVRYRQEQADQIVWHVDFDECDAEEQAAYEQALARAEIELAWLLPATVACPRAER